MEEQKSTVPLPGAELPPAVHEPENLQAPPPPDMVQPMNNEPLPDASPGEPLAGVPSVRRTITTHRVNVANEQLTIEVLDEPGAGGANHLYNVRGFNSASNPSDPFVARYGEPAKHSTVLFQNGPIGEVGVNGVTHEALLAILEDRLTAFQAGHFACEENKQALAYIRAAQHCLKMRTVRRVVAGTEGTHKGN